MELHWIFKKAYGLLYIGTEAVTGELPFMQVF